MTKISRNNLRERRKKRFRAEGTKEIPRLSVFRSAKRMYIQLVDDSSQKTLAGILSNLGEKGKRSQHLGLGKQLMEEAEKISKKNKCKEIKVISGVGVREYYRKLGYELDDDYMVKVI